MIEKERLQELIEQQKQVWKIYKDTCQGVYQVPAGLFGIGFSSQVDETTPFNELFETKEEAEWYREFGCIERTERLWFPTWESVYNDLKDYKDGDFYIIDNDHFSFVYNKCYVSPQLFLYTHNEKFNWNANKENYYQACKLAKKIFLGEIE